jgi:hypothetical protein
MHKYTGRLTVVCAAVGLALAPGAAMAKKPKYPIPPVKGGTTSTKSAATTAATSLQKTTGKTLASKGLKVKVTFTSAGKITITVKGGGKTINVKFSAAGKTFLKTGAGKKVTVTVTFKPTTGKSSTSTSTVKLG